MPDIIKRKGFLGDSVIKDLPVNAADMGLIPGLGRSPGGGNDSPLQYPCLGNPMDIGAGWATVHVVWKSQTQLSSHTDTLDRIWESNIFSHCTMQLRYIKLLHILVDPKGHGLGEEKDGQGHLKRGSESRTSWVPKYTALWVRWQQRWRPR